jgi:ABC-type multidrug transport system fused ATPase/permease subunit
MSEQDQMRIDEKWPLKGEIIFTCVTMRYRDDLEPALKNVSFKVESGMKVGIVGRTGSGKSSILQVLFRLIKLEAGSIEIDNIDIRDVGLHLLRSNIGFIPQMPFLLQGTLYENLDPFNEHTIEEVEDALEKV